MRATARATQGRRRSAGLRRVLQPQPGQDALDHGRIFDQRDHAHLRAAFRADEGCLTGDRPPTDQLIAREPKMPTDIVISYRRKDSDRVLPLVDALRNEGGLRVLWQFVTFCHP
jgi:hypothetical protein